MQILSIVSNVTLAFTSLGVSYLFMKHYPKEINNFFGYRTKRSMASHKAWLLANRYSSELLFKCSLACTLLQVILFILFDAKVALLSVVTLWIVSLFAIIFSTEQMLKRTL